MSRPGPCAAGAAVSLVLAACGGSAGSSSSQSRTASSSVAPQSAPLTASTTSTATTSSRPPQVPKDKAPKHSKPTAPNTNVRIPAAFTIATGGGVNPPLISVPPKVTIELALRNRDSRAHRVQLPVAHFPSLTVRPGGSRTTEVSGVAKGDYRLLVDGAPKARIVVGAVPGP